MNSLYSNVTTNTQLIGEKSLNDFFDIPPELNNKFKTLGNSILIHDTIYNKKNFNLLKLISYFLFNKTKQIFKSGTANMNDLKYQVGKDYHRIDVQINGTPIPKSLFPEETVDTSHYYQIVDNLNIYIMELMFKQNIPIKINTIIKIDILLTQYLFGLIIDSFITILLKQNLMIISGKKYVNIILTQTEQKMKFYYTSDIINMDDIESDNRGNISIIIYTNLLDNTFYMDIDLSYSSNVTTNNDATNNDATNNVITTNNDSKPITSDKFVKNMYNYANNYKPEIAAGLATTSLLGVGTLFLTGLLGGKLKTRKIKKYKTTKSKSYKNYNKS